MTAELWRLGLWLLAPDAGGRLIRQLRPEPARRILDVGCGPASLLWTAGLEPYGADLSPGFVRAFHRRSPRAAIASAMALPFADGRFDAVYSFGLLHHLPDEAAAAAVREMLRVTRPGGRTIVLDGVPPSKAWRRPVASLLRRLDRGRWMRRQEALQNLLDGSGGWEYKRFTYTYTGLEGVLCAHRC